MKLDELLGKDSVPGSMKARISSWDQSDYFIPYFKDRNGFWQGLNSKGYQRSFHENGSEWEVYKKPLHSIDELVEQQLDFIPGKLKLINEGEIFYPYFLDSEDDWIGHDNNNEHKVVRREEKLWRIAND